jgi:hypothetical protein
VGQVHADFPRASSRDKALVGSSLLDSLKKIAVMAINVRATEDTSMRDPKRFAFGVAALLASLLPGAGWSAPILVNTCLSTTPTGNPCPGAAPGTFTINLVNFLTPLPEFVVAGDVVLLERVPGSTAQSNWSDVVRFPDLGNGLANVAQLFSDPESGLPGFILQRNSVFIPEDPLATSTDMTPYIPCTAAGSCNFYTVFSDSPLNESDHGEPNSIPEPGTLSLVGLALGGAALLNHPRRNAAA